MVSDMEQELRFQRWKDVVLDVARTGCIDRCRIDVLEVPWKSSKVFSRVFWWKILKKLQVCRAWAMQ
eukprot:g27465.t1